LLTLLLRPLAHVRHRIVARSLRTRRKRCQGGLCAVLPCGAGIGVVRVGAPTSQSCIPLSVRPVVHPLQNKLAVLADENAALRRENERLRQLLHAHGISADAEIPFGAAAASSSAFSAASSAAPSSRCAASAGAGRAAARASPALAGSAAASASSSSLRKSSIITANSTDSQATVTASAAAAACETAAPKLRAGALAGAKGRGGSGRKGKTSASATAAARTSSPARAMEVDGDSAQPSALAATGADVFTSTGQHQATPSWVGSLSGAASQAHSPHASDRSGSSSSDLLFSDDDEEEEGDGYGEEAEGRDACASASPASQAALAALASGALSLHTASSDHASGSSRLLTPEDLQGAHAAPARCSVGASASASAGSGGAVWDALFALPSAASVVPNLLSSAPLRLMSVASVDGMACSASAAPAASASAAGSASSGSLLAPSMPGGLLSSCVSPFSAAGLALPLPLPLPSPSAAPAEPLSAAAAAAGAAVASLLPPSGLLPAARFTSAAWFAGLASPPAVAGALAFGAPSASVAAPAGAAALLRAAGNIAGRDAGAGSSVFTFPPLGSGPALLRSGSVLAEGEQVLVAPSAPALAAAPAACVAAGSSVSGSVSSTSAGRKRRTPDVTETSAAGCSVASEDDAVEGGSMATDAAVSGSACVAGFPGLHKRPRSATNPHALSAAAEDDASAAAARAAVAAPPTAGRGKTRLPWHSAVFVAVACALALHVCPSGLESSASFGLLAADGPAFAAPGSVAGFGGAAAAAPAPRGRLLLEEVDAAPRALHVRGAAVKAKQQQAQLQREHRVLARAAVLADFAAPFTLAMPAAASFVTTSASTFGNDSAFARAPVAARLVAQPLRGSNTFWGLPALLLGLLVLLLPAAMLQGGSVALVEATASEQPGVETCSAASEETAEPAASVVSGANPGKPAAAGAAGAVDVGCAEMQDAVGQASQLIAAPCKRRRCDTSGIAGEGVETVPHSLLLTLHLPALLLRRQRSLSKQSVVQSHERGSGRVVRSCAATALHPLRFRGRAVSAVW